MKTQTFAGKLLPYATAVGIFILIALVYCSPTMQGKTVQQSDVLMARGMQQEMFNFHKETGGYTLWTNSMFGGMPTYQIGGAGVPKYNIFAYLANIVRLNLPEYSVDIIFLYLICFFILLVALGVNPWLSIAGAIAFGFTSYNFIIIGVGHINKALVIALMPAILGGFLLVYNQKYVKGAILLMLSLGINLQFNHVQMTYYLFIAIGIFLIVEFIYHLIEKRAKAFIISSLVALGASILALAPNTGHLLLTYEYSKVANRGTSELTKHNKDNKGTDKEYALSWSYGKAETLTFLVPNLYGGESTQNFTEKSKVYEALIANRIDRQQAREIVRAMPTTLYWGDQPGTSGPVYLGAVVCFLFVLGLFLTDLKTRLWILAAIIITVFLSWGRNFMWFTDLFFNYVPLYNKFRAVSSILVIPSILFPLAAFLGLKKLVQGEVDKTGFLRYMKYALGITGGILLFLLAFGGSLFSFSSPYDAKMLEAGYPNWLVESAEAERLRLFRADALRSLVFVILTATLLTAFYFRKIKFGAFALFLSLLVVTDMWGINRRYLNNDNFVPKKKANKHVPTAVDLQILNDKTPHYRVFNVTMNPFNESLTSYYHKSIGGYHGAKIRRYEELISYHISQQNMQVINMLNTRYFILPGKDKQPYAQFNEGALGNAWFVNKLQVVENADEELDALYSFDARRTAVIDKRFIEQFPELASIKIDTTLPAQIRLTSYAPNHLVYESETESGQFAVFSEIYYNSGKGWNAYIDGEKAEHVRVNYVLRGMLLPAGKHTIEFKFEPKLFYTGLKIEGLSSIVVVLVIIGLAFVGYRKR
ncbi:MAG: YfhO family protein [Bacteroidales bacterium]|nr:YfhO family protein [Bacteroidales bacterium]